MDSKDDAVVSVKKSELCSMKMQLASLFDMLAELKSEESPNLHHTASNIVDDVCLHLEKLEAKNDNNRT